MAFETFDFHLTQLKYLKTAVDHIDSPSFRPDGKTPTQIATLLTDGNTALTDLLEKSDQLNVARGALEAAHAAGHDACVAVYACMKSCYRDDRSSLAAIQRLPKTDRTPSQTVTRMKATSQRWSALPNAPGTKSPLTVGDLTVDSFDKLLADLDDKLTAYTDCSGQFQSEQAAFGQQDEAIAGFVTAGLVQGRASYKPGSPQRAYIDAIPTESSTRAPGQAVVSLATSPAARTVHLEFSAPHATSFKVWHKGPNDADFAPVGESLSPGVFDAVGVTPGTHSYQVVPHNSRGDGPTSDPVTVAVAAAQAA